MKHVSHFKMLIDLFICQMVRAVQKKKQKSLPLLHALQMQHKSEKLNTVALQYFDHLICFIGSPE